MWGKICGQAVNWVVNKMYVIGPKERLILLVDA